MKSWIQLGEAKKLVKIKNAMVMVYVSQCLSGTAMLNALFNIHAEACWLTERECQLFDNLMHKRNSNDKYLRMQIQD